MRSGKRKYTVYGLSVNGSGWFFYIGVTSGGVSYRLSMHLSEARTGNDINKAKCNVIKDNGFDIVSTEIFSKNCDWREALKIEKYYIDKYFNEGHPLTNKVPSCNEKSGVVRVRETTHKKAKHFAFKSESTVTEVIDCALLWFMQEFPAEKFKLNKPTKK